MNSEPNNHLPSTPGNHVHHHLPPVHIKSLSSSSSASFSISFNTPTSKSSSTSNPTPTSSARRRIGIAVDLSDESAFSVKWAVENYIRSGDAVILLHICPTAILYGADWGSSTPTSTHTPPSSPSIPAIMVSPNPHDQKLEEDYDNLTNTKATNLAQPLVEAHVPFKIHIVKDHDLKERLCLEVKRLGLSSMIMGSRGFGTMSRRNSKGGLGSVSDYCVNHCVCPVVVVRYTEEENGGKSSSGGREAAKKAALAVDPHPMAEEELQFHDVDNTDWKDAAST